MVGQTCRFKPFPGMPKECLPVDGKPRGRLSYTITSSSGAKVEVLLKAKAFRIVKIAVVSRAGHLESKHHCASSVISCLCTCRIYKDIYYDVYILVLKKHTNLHKIGEPIRNASPRRCH